MSDIYIKKILSAKVYDVAIETPIDEAIFLSKRIKNRVFIKREDLQPVFSFKLRGAYNKMYQLTDKEKLLGIVAASAGNHAQGVALAAKKLGIKATIVMPVTTPKIKVISVREHGAEVILFGDNFNEALEYAKKLESKNSLIFIHPYDDPEVIAGQGTIGMEISRQFPNTIDYIFIPVGGGGLAAGVGTYLKYLRPDIRVIAVESDESACLKAALESDSRVILDRVGIFADGVAVKQIGENTFDLCKSCIDEVITVNTDEICAAIKDLFEDTRSIAEPAGALSLAGLKKYCEENNIEDKTVMAIESGANVNFDKLRFISEVSEFGERREFLLSVTIPEERGSFRKFCIELGEHSITEFNYRTSNKKQATILVGVRVKHKKGELEKLISHLEKCNYTVSDLTDSDSAKRHVRHMVGGHRLNEQINEAVFSIDFPEKPGALTNLLNKLEDSWNISMFHYRNEGSVVGRGLIGFQYKNENKEDLLETLDRVGYNYLNMENDKAYNLFLG
ncbi:threonine ammonia-lyase, biosynthetic [Thiospirochaeta perfilievii]|uniref:L-threonine dehydratase n=1 Tax=Thiospirochaeta perfilievii TaxID=252967 RepID=A0A5C1QAT7_9SPIO|nr:threonine ammonia-lyase, biosynthetic [Thiospirochaeta perfilievii]QEN03916.1 threonine ammonia-lyase, biosynthetic [Thiospirochaeta perfilievii]